MNKQLKNAIIVVGGAVVAYLIYRNLSKDDKKNADGKKCNKCLTTERVLVDLPINTTP